MLERGVLKVDRREVVLSVGLTALVTFGFWLDAHARGVIGVPRNDDWVYLRLVDQLRTTGQIEVNPWVSAMTVGHVVLVQPIYGGGGDVTNLKAAVAVMGALGILAGYWYARLFLTTLQSAAVVGCLVVSPMFGVLDISFMTDVPAFSFSTMALLAGGWTLSRTRVSLLGLIGCGIFSLIAISIRESAIAVPVAVILAAFARRGIGGESRAKVLAFGLLLVASVTVLVRWRSGLPGAKVSEGLTPKSWDEIIGASLATLCTLGLLVSPIWVIASPKRLCALLRGSEIRLALICALGLVTLVVFPYQGNNIFLGDTVVRTGAFPRQLGLGAPDVYPAWLWLTLHVVGIASTALAAFVLYKRLKRQRLMRRPAHNTEARLAGRNMVAVTLVALVGFYAVQAPSIFDRYLLGVIVPAGAVLASSFVDLGLTHRPSIRRVMLGYAPFAIVAVLVADSLATVEGLASRMADELVRGGYASSTVDAGYAWFGAHQSAPVVNLGDGPAGDRWYLSLFESRQVCARIGFKAEEPHSVGPMIASRQARTLFGLEYRLVARSVDEGC